MRKAKKQVDNFERSSITYFNEIGKYNGLTKDEEFKLWNDFKKNHNLESRNKLLTSNLKFVASVAKGYQGLGLSYGDLIAEGNIGLLKAMDKFDGEKGNKFISYSVWWIKQNILEALNIRNGIHGDDVPTDFEEQYDFYDDNDEKEPDTSLFSTFVTDDTENIFRSSDINGAVSILMSCLDDRERYIVSEYYGLNGEKPKTLQEIGDKINLTKERVRQINEKALKKLRAEALNNYISADIYK